MSTIPSHDDPALQSLIVQAKTGDENAFAELLKRYSPLMDSLTRQFAPEVFSEHDRQDLRQEAVIAFFKALQNYEPDQNVGFGYFAKVCMENRLTSYLRKWNREPAAATLPLESETEIPSEEEADPLRYVMEKEQYLSLCETIRDALSDYENRIWTLFMLGATAEEIANRLGKEKKSIENAIFRVRSKLRAVLPPR